MNPNIQAIIRAGGICAFLSTTSLTAFYGWYKAVSIPQAEASSFNIQFSPDLAPDSIALNPQEFQQTLEQAEVFEKSRDLAFLDFSHSPVEIRLAPPLYIEENINILEPNTANTSSPITFTDDTSSPKIDDIENEDPNVKIVALEQGSNIMNMLTEQGVENNVFWEIYEAVKPIYSLNKVPAGKEFTLTWDNETGSRKLASIDFSIDKKTKVQISRQENGSFFASKIERPTVRQMLRADAVIDSSLFAAGSRVGIPQTTMANLLKVFSWDIDFERDVKKGDKLNVLYNCEFDQETGQRLACNDILFASMVVGGQTKSLYAYTHDDGKIKYYSEKGFSAKKQFMKTPISMNRARISSNYGYRKHPTLNYSKMHSGVDFAAPTGTPIYAAADGVISQRGRYGAAGNMVVIKHGKYVTRYLHMNGFKKGQKVGQRVSQGDIIGYVGTTGRSTGPHLHYEIRLASNNTPLNPLKVSPISNTGLQDKAAKDFQKKRKEIDTLYASSKPNYVPNPTEVLAAIEDGSIDTRLASMADNKYIGEKEISISEVEIKPRPADLIAKNTSS